MKLSDLAPGDVATFFEDDECNRFVLTDDRRCQYADGSAIRVNGETEVRAIGRGRYVPTPAGRIALDSEREAPPLVWTDAAERMLVRIWNSLYPTTRTELRQIDDEIRRWDDANGDANERRIRINVLTVTRDRQRADLAATEAKLAELAALDGGGKT